MNSLSELLRIKAVAERLAFSQLASNNAAKMRRYGVHVLHGIDATCFDTLFSGIKFDNIVFQFPHSGSRESVEGRNPNYVLLRDFLAASKPVLARSGKILVTMVDTPFYRGVFQVDDAASEAGFSPPEAKPFDPGMFPGYTHTMTHEDGSALEKYDSFVTWIFRKEGGRA